ncbi:MAG: molybdate transport system substrate-binding protein [Solirubrobacteraceae bacterium]|nr:molybdate transport system substrate-binding protein [Solirubrobacteraceae bacterium]
MRGAGVVALVAVAAALGVASCGGAASGGEGGRAERPRLVVSAASSLKNAFTGYARGYRGADVRLSFAGSDDLAAQIRQGVRPDVFAAANSKLPDQLAREGLVERPRVFAGNELVIAVPADRTGVAGLADLARGGVDIALGAEGVPAGDYARQVLARLPAAERGAIMANVRSNEPDVKGVVGKLIQGAVAAGFVYRTDVVATDGRLRAVALPRALKPKVAYGAAVVKGAAHPAAARAFIAGLIRGRGAAALRAQGFLPPPRS